jgi:hypothetical protein
MNSNTPLALAMHSCLIKYHIHFQNQKLKTFKVLYTSGSEALASPRQDFSPVSNIAS